MVFFFLRFVAWSIQWSIAVAIFLLVMAGSGYYVYHYALEGGRHVTVPNVVDIPITEAALLLAESGLEMGRQVQAPHPTMPKYFVIAQRPSAGRVAREGRRVNIIVSMGQDYLRAPALVGMSLEDARREVTQSRFRVGSLARIPGDQPRDIVLAQDPPVGGELPDQGEIHLLVSAGLDRPSALMPDLRGIPVADVGAALEGFDVIIVANEVDIPGAQEDVVLAQQPAADTLIYQNQVITYDYKPSGAGSGTTMLFEATVRHQMFFDYYSRDVRVDVIDRMGNRQTEWSKAPANDEASRARYVAGTAIRVPIRYISEATVEVYIDGALEAAYRLKDGSPPIKTN